MSYERIAAIGAKDKGGVGLSTSLTALATILMATGEGKFEVQLVDADGFNGTLLQRLGQRDQSGKLLHEQQPGIGVIKANLFDEEGVRPMFRAVESDARFVVIDTPAGAVTKFDELSRNLKARDFIDHCRQCGRQPVVFLPFTPGVASIRGVGQAIERFGSDVPYVGLRNMVGAKDKDFRLWRPEPFTDRYGRQVGGRVRARFDEVGGRLLDMPVAEAGPFAMAEALSLTFAESARYKGPDWESYDRLDMVKWLEAWVTEFRKIEDLLGLGDIEWKAF
ncbi:hypothetical protein [Sphingomonas sp. NPDC079357]|uniref:hypothetical protein n=1 Tax=Sphingomonas sp. NPDC079357 TaxID=3364518 RepID=UPI00384ED8E7